MQRVAIRICVTGMALMTFVSTASHILESRGYHELVDETLWMWTHLLGGSGVVLAMAGLAIIVLVGIFGEP